jgi:hypothetical protein
MSSLRSGAGPLQLRHRDTETQRKQNRVQIIFAEIELGEQNAAFLLNLYLAFLRVSVSLWRMFDELRH